MSRNLHVAKVWQIEYGSPKMNGDDGQEVLYRILEMFDVDNSAEDIYTDDFEIERTGLQDLCRHITVKDEVFQKQAEEFNTKLDEIGMSREEFIAILDHLINDSDPSDAYIHVSWF